VRTPYIGPPFFVPGGATSLGCRPPRGLVLAARNHQPQTAPRSTPSASLVAARTSDSPPGESRRDFQSRAQRSPPSLVRSPASIACAARPAAVSQRYERIAPANSSISIRNQLTVGRILRVGHRMHSAFIRTCAAAWGGWEFFCTCTFAVYDYSPAAYRRSPFRADGRDAAAFVRRTVVFWFARRGSRVSRPQPTNGSVTSVGRLSAPPQCAARVRLTRTRGGRTARRPLQSRTLHSDADSRGWAYAVSYPTVASGLALRPWLRHYNVERPHAAARLSPPCVRFPMSRIE